MKRKGDIKTKSGANASKHKAGYEIGHNAPATFVMLVDTKLKSAGYSGIEKTKLTDIDKSDADYREKYAKQLYNMIV